MLRTVVCSTSRRSAAVASTLASCRWLTAYNHHPIWTSSLILSLHPSTVARPSLLTSRRTAATASTASEADFSSAAALTDAEIIAAADWKSPQYEERLGFRGGDAITEARLKRHYYVLAKHFHPDTATGTAAGAASENTAAVTDAEAFHNIKEAYDAISTTLKEGSNGRPNGNGNGSADGSNGSASSDFAGGFTYSDEARRRSQMRLLGEAVMLFMAMTVMLIFIVSRHNKSRMQSRYLWHLVWIFFMIQLFPRLLAAAIIFAAHSLYLVDNTALKEQAAISLVVERSATGCTVKLDGIHAGSVSHVVVQVTTTATKTAAGGAQEEVSSTLTFDKGVTEFLLPVPAVPHSVYHIKAVDEQRKLVLVDRTISALV
ncbi:putative mitochondrial heat shock protein [Leptomonas pyrrhocoris]|uniref:Putative mitochondrial heat shock protein n=1 Tax=Leptomonas pyrrhocoris TaxID=157538 RepID=A0A0M9G0U2_LEPPY|nr:putative mitochondrial heat shock protein [Leptomonas pyrrhocoris]XP_015658474.1 putative mitochondrial heat shock protein [Leptomonas pyrrhocoris]KPA80034.1 putative mitochondrial heat shock protein [Leptomonas pyrrhocoris]KPA80035.1 putative mitochondrial heat shock protein [Leptomonas pyrrhocoris]|eukprot:XP_015658473.1 putative mitochondrial heat shock protein [Leptomonas pyrrhocoris]